VEELKTGSLLLAALFGLPGFVFLHILAKFCFSSARFYGGKTFQVIASFIFSTIIIYIFDSSLVHPHIPELLHILNPFGFQPSDEYIKFLTDTQLNQGLFGYIFLNKKPVQLSYLVATLVFVVSTFAVFCSIAVAVVIGFLEWYSKSDLSDFFVASYHFASFILRKFCSFFVTDKMRKRRLRHLLDGTKQANRFEFLNAKLGWKNFFYLIPIKIVEGISFLVFFIVVLVLAFGILILLSTLNLISEGILYIFHKWLDMFRHPCEKIFEPYKFSARVGVPLVEILSSENRINKGRLVAFQPKNSEELLSVTITNVIQYNKASETPFFDRSDRHVYEFPDRNSRLTIGSESIKDINVGHMRYTDFDWQFKILDAGSIRNQLWYLKLILERHKARFGFDKFSAWIDSRFALLFFLELLQLIENAYSFFFYKYKLRKLVNQLRFYLRPYRLNLKQTFAGFTPDEQQEIAKSRSALAAALWKVRTKIRN